MLEQEIKKLREAVEKLTETLQHEGSQAAPEKEPKNQDQELVTPLTDQELGDMVRDKGKKHRDDIRNKLHELGATRIANLPQDKKPEFGAFLEGLK